MFRKAWMNGSLPSDLTELAYLCRVNPRTMRKVWPKLEPFWIATDGNNGRIISKKMERERKFLEEKRNLASNAGKASAKARKIKETSSTDVQLYRSTSQPSPSLPIPTIKEGDIKPLAISSPMVPGYSEAFEEFWKKSTKRGSKVEAYREWKKLGPKDCLIIQDGMTAWMNSDQWRDETKQPHICRWLKRRGWEELVPRSLLIHDNGNGNHTSSQIKPSKSEIQAEIERLHKMGVTR